MGIIILGHCDQSEFILAAASAAGGSILSELDCIGIHFIHLQAEIGGVTNLQ